MAEDWQEPQLQEIDWNAVQREPFQRAFMKPVPSEDAEETREELNISIEDDAGLDIPAPIKEFQELDMLPEYVSWGLAENNITKPMPIQAQALPLVLSGYDVIGLAQTGSGKTLAFLLPAVVHIESQSPLVRQAPTPIVLVLAPTRELAVQISEEAMKVLRYSQHGNHRNGVWAVVLYGGGNKREQQKNLSWGSHIVVATPGRLIDFIAAKSVSLERVTYLVLDEADRMLDMGFQSAVSSIAAQVRPERQVLFFSATWSKDVQGLARGLCQEGSHPVRMGAGQRASNGDDMGHQAARAGIIQQVVVVDHQGEGSAEKQQLEKEGLLDRYLDETLSESDDNKVLVFVSQKQFADDLCTKLEGKGYTVGAMHGGKAQETRLWVLDQFRKGQLRVLVATDVLGRGIDIPKVSHVVVFDMGSIEDYIHRIGRTARGKNATGRALVFFEYYWKMPGIAAELIDVLQNSKQPVPLPLRTIAREVERGEREVFNPKAKWGKSSWTTGSNWGDGWSGGGYTEKQPNGYHGRQKWNGGGADSWAQDSEKSRSGKRSDEGGIESKVVDSKVQLAEDIPDSWDD